jgi:hypothetical protein
MRLSLPPASRTPETLPQELNRRILPPPNTPARGSSHFSAPPFVRHSRPRHVSLSVEGECEAAARRCSEGPPQSKNQAIRQNPAGPDRTVPGGEWPDPQRRRARWGAARKEAGACPITRFGCFDETMAVGKSSKLTCPSRVVIVPNRSFGTRIHRASHMSRIHRANHRCLFVRRLPPKLLVAGARISAVPPPGSAIFISWYVATRMPHTSHNPQNPQWRRA